MSERVLTGGCLCGALRYEARGTPSYTGYCFCGDCRKASGSGFVPFMGFAAGQVTVTGQVLLHSLKLADGRVSDRNHSAACGSLVFGGKIGNAKATPSMPARSTIRPRSNRPSASSYATSPTGFWSRRGSHCSTGCHRGERRR